VGQKWIIFRKPDELIPSSMAASASVSNVGISAPPTVPIYPKNYPKTTRT
jgi:hypothetical protein